MSSRKDGPWEKRFVAAMAEDDAAGILGWEIALSPDGHVRVSEGWPDHDEVWSAGVSIYVPSRVWVEFAKWLAGKRSAA